MSKFCPSCGEKLVDNAKFCKNCGTNLETNENVQQTYQVPMVENDHKLAVILGYICSVLFPLIGIIIGIYLATRSDSKSAPRHGKYIIIIGLVIWIISYLLIR